MNYYYLFFYLCDTFYYIIIIFYVLWIILVYYCFFLIICGYVLNGFSVIKQIFLAALENYEGRKEMFYLTTYSTHFYLRLYGVGHMVIGLTNQIVTLSD